MTNVKAGKLRAIAVTGKNRLATLPEVPTFEEAGVQVDASGWQGVAVPVGTPREAVLKLSDAVAKAIAQPDVREKFAAQGLDPATSSADQMTAHIRAEVEKWIRVAKSANIKVD